MKFTALLLLTFLFLPASADQTEVKVKSTMETGDEDQAIIIQKRKIKDRQGLEQKVLYEVVSGTAEIEGDESYDEREARGSWDRACQSWKSEMKELNRENSLIALNCGRRSKVKNRGRLQFVSMASYQVRVRLSE